MCKAREDPVRRRTTAREHSLHGHYQASTDPPGSGTLVYSNSWLAGGRGLRDRQGREVGERDVGQGRGSGRGQEGRYTATPGARNG